MSLLNLFPAIALILAAIGVNGVISCSVNWFLPICLQATLMAIWTHRKEKDEALRNAM